MVVILLGMIYQHFHDPNVKHLFAGLAAAAAGLLIQMAVKIRAAAQEPGAGRRGGRLFVAILLRIRCCG
jgi:chromate transport protein ChrA